MKTRNALEGIGAAFLILLPYYSKFLLPSNLVLYHLQLPVTNIIGGLLVDIFVYSILAMGFLVAIRCLSPGIQRVADAMFAGLMLWVIVDFAILIVINQGHPIENWGKVWWRSVIAVPLLSGALAYFLPCLCSPAVRAIRLVVAGFAFSSVWITPHLIRLMLAHQPANSIALAQMFSSSDRDPGRRIIWILFDELSYDQTFDHQVSGIRLPNFDRLHKESVSFSDLKPTGYQTDLIIPSLFLGQRINRIRSTIHGGLLYLDESQHRWRDYNPNATLFGLAQRNGWSPGIDGWVVPLCRILAPVLSACSWEPISVLPKEEFDASEEKSVLANALILPNRFLIALTNKTTTPADSHIADAHIQDYRDIMAHAQTLIDDGQARFIFLHLPLPHPPGIYDRTHHVLGPGGTYLDNLVLADKTLGLLMQDIDATPSAGQTTVIVSSDHSWRVPLWRHAEHWSDEEEHASGGRFDDRPVLLIHFPGQKNGDDIDAALPELLEHDFIVDMLRGQMNSPENMASFLSPDKR